MRFVTAHRTAELTSFARGVMDAGSHPRALAVLVLAAAAAMIAVGAWRAAVAGVLALAAATVVAPMLKGLVERPRPAGALTLVDPGGYAFPSSHAARAAALSVAVAVGWQVQRRFLRRVLVGGLVAANLVLGVLLVYLGAHWPTDVLAGWLVGALLGWLVAHALLLAWPPPGAGAVTAGVTRAGGPA